MPNQFIIFLFAILTLASAVWCEIVTHSNCEGHVGKCTVHEVRVDPCAEAAESKPCSLKRGKTAKLEADFTAQFAADSLHARAYWPNGLIELPLLGMETDACKTTTCPVVEGNRQTYGFDLKLSRAFPSGVYDVKWKISGENDDDECCFMIKINLK